MTGVEAAGLVLGVLPLLISAAEHYDDVFTPFKRFREFVPEIELYQQQLNTQKTIFRNECQCFLATLIGHQKAREMVRESEHSSWGDTDLDEKFARQLGDSGTACKTVINLIHEKLRVVEEESKSFGLDIQQSMPLGSIGDKAWRSRLRKKFKFCLSESRLEKSLEGLRTLNQDFRTLASQTKRLQTQYEDLPTSVQDPPRTHQKVEESRIIRKASAQLCNALEKACQIHEKHSAHFRLDSQYVSLEGTGLPLIRFNLVFAHFSSSTSAMFEPVWIVVDSTLEKQKLESQMEGIKTARHQAHESLNNLSRSLKHDISPPCPVSRKKVKTNSVGFLTTAPCANSSPMTTLVASDSAKSTLPDFCVQRDFCKQLQRCYTRSADNKYVGYLEKSGPYKHLVYFPPPVTACVTQSTSLAQIVLFLSKRSRADQLLEYEILRLARQLASAVLQHHATPLLKGSWRSDDIVFFGSTTTSAHLDSPHLHVQVCNPHNANREGITDNAAPSNDESQGIIQNNYLFSLGIILIELAYQSPLCSLRKNSDQSDGRESKLAEFFIADRLSKSVGTNLGVSYAKIVRKCLRCDFGEGTTDLSDPALQSVFYKDVVYELGRLETEFMKLQLET